MISPGDLVRPRPIASRYMPKYASATFAPAAAPDIGRTLNRAAPFMAVAVFALAAYVSWRSVFDLANYFIAG